MFIFDLLVFVMGLCCGSFVNMLVYRTAINYKLKKKIKSKIENEKRSFCDFCGKQLHWYENIPVISWVIQKGKSRCCGKRLPYQYPMVEILTGVLFLLIGGQIGPPLQMITGFVFITLLVFSTVFDLKYMILPDFSTYILVGLSLFLLLINKENIFLYLLSAVGASGFLLFLNLITKGKGMGLGDVKLAIFMGLFLGWPKILVAMYAAFISGAVVGVILIINKKAKRKTLIPFGPFLIFGTLFAYYLNFRFPIF